MLAAMEREGRVADSALRTIGIVSVLAILALRFYAAAWTIPGRLRRLVSEFVVSDKTLSEPGVVRRRVAEYANSAFDILVPRRFVLEYYRKSGKKNGPQSLRLAIRLTYTYSDFKRFDVSTVTAG